MLKDELVALLAPFGQEQVLAFWEQLDAAGRESLSRAIRQLDLALIRRLYEHRGEEAGIRQLAERAGPPPAFRLAGKKEKGSGVFYANRLPGRSGKRLPTPFPPEHASRKLVLTPFSCTRAEALARGRQALDAGQVGAILVAGGQGTRLGFHHPKGMYPIGPLSGRTLFQIHIEKILATARRHKTHVPLYLMTSPATHAETLEFLARHERFGLAVTDLVVFCQGTMPAIEAASGKLLLESPGRLASSPGGHGGMLAAFAASGAMADARRRGIRELFYFQVDNPLVEICGPEYIGYHLLCRSEMTTQVIAKRDPLERVGNVVEVDGRLMVIEYSDLPEDVARRRTPEGGLAVWAGSIAVHVFELGFLERVAEQADALPFHYARKKVACVDGAGRRVVPAEPNALKFERFIFDLMPLAHNAIVVEVAPARAFGPLKNAPGAAEDTPQSVQEQMSAVHRQWLRAAGAEVADDVAVEINPLAALDAEELATKVRPGLRISTPTYLGPDWAG